MLATLIRWSIDNRVIVLGLTAMLVVAGLYALRQTPLDAIPDLSDVQVIVKTRYPGQAPRVVEDQVTYPLTTAMLSVPGAVSVRGYSFFGDSYVYILFEDGTDLYWARSRVLEILSQVSARLPEQAHPELGPDATGVGWIYEYAVVDRNGNNDLAQLTSLQNWFLKYELQAVPGVAEVATVGGMVRQYQVVIDPNRLRAYGLSLDRVRRAVQRASQETGGSVVEMAEAEYIVRAAGYVRGVEDLEQVPLGVSAQGTPVQLRDLAEVRIGPQMRRGIAELDGEGEVVGGIVVMRWGGNALATIDGVKAKLQELRASLPPGVEIVETYDRSALIQRSVDTLSARLVEELAIVALICAVFLFHLRSALVIVIPLPIAILAALIVMRLQGINANIMSLGGIAIAIGTMVDAAIVMTENVHKHIERAGDGDDRWRTVTRAVQEVGPAVFFSLVIITLSFLPVFALQAQEGRLFAPLAFTKTYTMAAAAILSVTLVPVLMGFFVRGRITPQARNPVNRLLVALYRPAIAGLLRAPRTLLVVCALIALSGIWPASRLGSEFMPDLDEGDLFYMPTTFPGISIGKAQELLQQTDKLIRTVPEVKRVFGKIGRADTATDPAPLTMIETMVQLEPRERWRPGLTLDGLKAELDALVSFPGLTNSWVMPIKTRLDMLATGIKTPVGVKVSGPELEVIQSIGEQIEQVVQGIPGTVSAFSERVADGRYLTVDIDRRAAARFGLNIADVQDVVSTAVGGMTVAETVEGLERYPINLRYPRAVRDSLERLTTLPIVTPSGAHLPLGEIAEVRIEAGPAMIKSENARPTGWTFVDIRDRDLGSYVAEAQAAVREQVGLPPGYSISWSGQYEYMLRARDRLAVLGPIAFGVIVLLLYINFRRPSDVITILGTLPLAAAGGFWLLYLLDYRMSVGVGVGFIALAGVTIELGVVMLVYLNQAWRERLTGRPAGTATLDDLRAAVVDGALKRVRPIVMTVATIFASLLPVMFRGGTGSEVMGPIAAPMVGGMVSTTLLALVAIPALFLVWRSRECVNPPDDEKKQ